LTVAIRSFRERFHLEYWLLISFFVGLIIAYLVPFKISLFPTIVDGFVAAFMFLAPIIVFVIIFNSTCSLMSKKRVAGQVIKTSVLLFASLVLGFSIFASIILSFLLLGPTTSPELSTETMTYITGVILTGLLRPVSMALFLGVVLAFALSQTSLFERAITISKITYEAQDRAFGILLRVFPVVAISLGGALYYNLGSLSLEVYAISMSLILSLGLAALSILMIIVERATHMGLLKLLKYSARIFAAGLSIGSSYLALPLVLRIFKRHFKVNPGVEDLVLSLGASLNRCGSVMGVLVVTFVAARYASSGVSWHQMTFLAIPVALIGFGSPGIQGGTLLVAMPVILHVIAPVDAARFVAIALALFVGGTTFVQAAINMVASGYVALLVDRLAKE